MADIDLTFLGEQIRRMQADLRRIWNELLRHDTELTAIRVDVAALRADVNDLRADVNDLRADVSDLKTIRPEMNARFDQVHQTMAANLAVVLAAIAELKQA